LRMVLVCAASQSTACASNRKLRRLAFSCKHVLALTDNETELAKEKVAQLQRLIALLRESSFTESDLRDNDTVA
uniref:SWIM-type domain-containing protein n=1 Tax=Gongylonema pulchrum TaxID=637853 RepID=A0A183ELG1_9BILA